MTYLTLCSVFCWTDVVAPDLMLNVRFTGDVAELGIIRKGQPLQVQVTLDTRVHLVTEMSFLSSFGRETWNASILTSLFVMFLWRSHIILREINLHT